MTLAVASLLLMLQPVPASGDEWREWGLEALERLREDLYLDDRGLYADAFEPAVGPSGPAFMWGCGVLLSALNAAAQADPGYEPWLREYADALRLYWNPAGPVPGLDVLPVPKPVDRYYDDNAWVVIALVETAHLLGDDSYLEFARDTMEYVLSGEDDVLGGGIYWRESDKASKNTCSNAPSAVAAYLLYQATGEERYKEAGDRLLDWLLPRLQDPEDHLMWDHQRLDGGIDEAKFSYNTALTFRALRLRAELCDDPNLAARDRQEAQRMAAAALARWQDPDTGALRDSACFAHLLVEALLELDPAYAEPVARALTYLRARCADPVSRYPERWDADTAGPLAKVNLIDQASAVRAFILVAALQGGA